MVLSATATPLIVAQILPASVARHLKVLALAQLLTPAICRVPLLQTAQATASARSILFVRLLGLVPAQSVLVDQMCPRSD
jgi:hypothetical protein